MEVAGFRYPRGKVMCSVCMRVVPKNENFEAPFGGWCSAEAGLDLITGGLGTWGPQKGRGEGEEGRSGGEGGWGCVRECHMTHVHVVK